MAKKLIAVIFICIVLTFSIAFVVINYDNLFTNNLLQQEQEVLDDNADKNKIIIDYEYIYF